jgi:hypothetical protein
VKVTSEGLQEVNCSGKPAKAIFASETPKHAENADRLVSLGCRLRYPFGNRLEKTLKPIRFNTSKDLAQEEQIPDSSYGFGRFGAVHYLLQKFVASRQSATHNVQHTAIVQLLKHLVRCQYGFGMLFRCLLQSRTQLGTRIAGRNFEGNRLRH